MKNPEHKGELTVGSAMSAMSAMIQPAPRQMAQSHTTSPTVGILPNAAGSSTTMTDMTGIADATVKSLTKIDTFGTTKRKTGGRTKGTLNKVTRDIRAALRDLAEGNSESVQGWLDQVAEKDPGEAIRLWLALLRFVTPTLQAAAIADVSPRRSVATQLYSMSDDELMEVIIDGNAAALSLDENKNSPPTEPPDYSNDELFQ